jgi:hypothetical protein
MATRMISLNLVIMGKQRGVMPVANQKSIEVYDMSHWMQKEAK